MPSIEEPTPYDTEVPLCSVVICTRNRPRELERCLLSVAALNYPRFEILIVESGGSTESVRDIATHFGARYTSEPVGGLSRARNHGGQEARGEFIAYLDDDSVAHPDWLRAAIVPLLSDSRIAVVSGRILPLDFQSSHQSLPDAAVEARVLDKSMQSWFEMANFGGIGDGGNMFFRRSIFSCWPGFDVRLGRGAPLRAHEEHLAFHEIIELGFRIVYEPASVVFHPVESDLSRRRKEALEDVQSSSAYLCLLAIEKKERQSQAIRFALEAFRGTARPWRIPTYSSGTNPAIPRWRILAAFVGGVWSYLRSRLSMSMQPMAAF